MLDDIERWFVRRGLPHFVERKTDGSILDAWTRALPLLVVAYLLLGFNALDLRNWTLGENLAAVGCVLAMLVAAWAISNRLRGVDDVRPPDRHRRARARAVRDRPGDPGARCSGSPATRSKA